MIRGVDVHAGYGRIDWAQVAASGVRFSIAKCSQGNEPGHGKDPTYERNTSNARANGIHVGAYHFAYPLPHGPGMPIGREPRAQAEAAFRASSGLGGSPGEIAPAVDAEWPPINEWDKWGCTASQISEWLHEYCEAATLLWGRLPLIYTYPDWWRGNGRSYHGLSAACVEWAAPYSLWMATYSHPGPGAPAPGKAPIVPRPWRDWSVWQYSADGSAERVPGINAPAVDRNCIRDEAALARLTGSSWVDPDAETQPSIRPPIDASPPWATVTNLNESLEAERNRHMQRWNEPDQD